MPGLDAKAYTAEKLGQLIDAIGMAEDHKFKIVNALDIYPHGQELVKAAKKSAEARAEQVNVEQEKAKVAEQLQMDFGNSGADKQGMQALLELDQACLGKQWLQIAMAKFDLPRLAIGFHFQAWALAFGECVLAGSKESLVQFCKAAGIKDNVEALNLFLRLQCLGRDDYIEIARTIVKTSEVFLAVGRGLF